MKREKLHFEEQSLFVKSLVGSFVVLENGALIVVKIEIILKIE